VRRRASLLVLLLVVSSGLARAEQGRGRASASTTVRISVPAVVAVSVPRAVDGVARGRGTIVRSATFSSSSTAMVTSVRPAVAPRAVLASGDGGVSERVVSRSGWMVREHALPAIPRGASAASAPRLIMEVWQF
jgi:hypothetical protein